MDTYNANCGLPTAPATTAAYVIGCPDLHLATTDCVIYPPSEFRASGVKESVCVVVSSFHPSVGVIVPADPAVVHDEYTLILYTPSEAGV